MTDQTTAGNTDVAESVLSQATPPDGAAGDKPAGSTVLADANGPGDGKAADGKTPDAAVTKKDDAKAPEKYEAFTVPQGMTLDAEMVEKFTPVLKDVGLTQVQAQKLVTAFAEHQGALVAAQTQAVAQQRTAWVAEFKALPDWQEQATFARRAVEQIGDPQAKQLLLSSWLGDHPVMLGFLAKVGKLLAEDRGGAGSGKGVGGPPVDVAALMYPTMKQK